MDSATQVRPANATKTDDRTTSAEDHKLVDRLVRLWRSKVERDLRTRYMTGRLLNERMGPPTERQPQGRRVLKKAAERLWLAESDLNRMRWYAHLIDVTTFRQDHPGVDTWTEFKAGLTELKTEYGFGERRPAANRSRPAFGGFARSLANVTSKLIGLDSPPDDAERARLVAGLRELAEAASSRLKINVVVAVE
jgi:hypothetical protein